MNDTTNEATTIDALLMTTMQKKRKSSRPPMTPAERKRAQRLRTEIGVGSGRTPLTAETLNDAILDSLAIMLRQGDPHGHARSIIDLASQPFFFAPQAANVLKTKLYGRVPRVMGDLDIDVRDYA